MENLCKLAILGNHLPRECGIATFTTDLTDAIATEAPNADCSVLAMNDVGQRHRYPERVRFEVPETDLLAYRRAADFLNVNAFDILCVQHEYGIFGGKAGDYLLWLLRELRMPVVTTLHTIIREPTVPQRQVMDELVHISERLVTMTEHGASVLRDVHHVSGDKIDVIPHGIPDVPFRSQDKDRLGFGGQSVILTFGLLSPDKGIEYVIDALPDVVARYPEAVYIVLGATHPQIKRQYGEAYRLSLELRARRLGVNSNVVFHDRFVSHSELIGFLSAADVYVASGLNPEQSTSGTLAYAVGAGKPVISTACLYARELLADGCGILVPSRAPDAIATELLGLLGSETRRDDLRERAAAKGRSMVWPAVARSYVRTFERARSDHAKQSRSVFEPMTLATRPMELPEINLGHLRVLTDDTGIMQHSEFCIPRYEDGYCLDDNARALRLVTLLEEAEAIDPGEVRGLASRYLAFVRYAFNAKCGRFRNFMAYDRRWLEECGSEDSHARALWALGSVAGRSDDPGRQTLACDLFHAALPAILDFTSPRAWAFGLLGIDEYLKAFAGEREVEAVHATLGKRLFSLFRRVSRSDWPWFEDRLTYSNARIAQALISSGRRLEQPEMVADGLRSLEWLLRLQCSEEGYFAPIGCQGFYVRGGRKALFDQQPVEACGTIAACFEAESQTSNGDWRGYARRAFDWFLGQNVLQVSLYDSRTGGCRDGLAVDRVNENQGAESTVAFLVSLLEMRRPGRRLAATSGAREAATSGAREAAT